ncbi:doublecortin domain-containing protein 2B isoform X1 [Falco naumanni]|uniref:doublecortin domain-containing protein 2B isoform X1 n=1 Tax=Falco naumanni TaxID=148594 RepID=UPI001ADE884D|nr:doublecortin domain-containing protein 2B isoform X1 [Falco naumanni]XP_040443744.1 doublecortin domain-containing protein 2B isoform X1 [Falco naumanni]
MNWGMNSCGLAPVPPAKNVVVYRNGDPFFPGRKFVVNQRRFLTFEVFLNEVTKSIHAPLAVRNLYTPRHGHRIAELGDLQDGCQYVAAGFEKFKKLNYLNHGRKELHGTRTSEGLRFHVVAPWKSNVLARWQKHARLPCTIHVFRNGDLLSPPFPLPLPKSTPLQWDTLLALLTKKADLRSGAVNKLCRLDGTQVSGGEELLNGNYYVAVGNEEYKKLPYFELLVPQDSARRTLWNHQNSRRKKYRRKFGELCASSQDRPGDSALAEPPQQVAMTAKSVSGVPCIFVTCSSSLELQPENAVLQLCTSQDQGSQGKSAVCKGLPCETSLVFINCVIKKTYQKCVMNTFSWTVTGCRPKELQRKRRPQLLFHNGKGKPGNLASKRKSPFSMLNLSVQGRTEGATGMCSAGLIKKKVSINPEILGRRGEVPRQ